jgi:hypothetical protein
MASQSAGIGSALPDLLGNSGLYLTTDGAAVTWAAVSGLGVTTMAAVGSTPSANGASISGSTLTLQPASSTLPGLVTAGVQTLGTGAKTIAGCVITSLVDGGAGFFDNGFMCSAQSWIAVDHAVTGKLWINGDSSVHVRVVGVDGFTFSNAGLDMTGLGAGGFIKLKSPNGTTYTATIANGGTWSIT